MHGRAGSHGGGAVGPSRRPYHGRHHAHCGGLEAHERLREEGVEVPTVILSATLDDRTILRCFRSEVNGIVLKESAASEFIDAVRTVAGGKKWIPPELTSRAAELVAREDGSEEEELTAREMDIVVEVAVGNDLQPHPAQPRGPGAGLDLGSGPLRGPPHTKVLGALAGSCMALQGGCLAPLNSGRNPRRTPSWGRSAPDFHEIHELRQSTMGPPPGP